MTAPLLQVEDVRLRRGAREVLAGTTFAVPRGSIAALMGPSGAGKTILLRAIAGLEPFDGGQIVVDGLALEPGPAMSRTRRKALRRKVGLVFQFHHLFEHMTVLENVCLAPVRAHGVSPAVARQRARELLTMLDVHDREHALPRELSGGEAQRVAVARALAVDPPLLLMDEPTASLDEGRRAGLGRLLGRLVAGNQRTIVLATHDEAFARAWSSQVVSLRPSA